MENTFPQFIIFKKQRWRACINSHAFRIDPNCFALFFIRGYFFSIEAKWARSASRRTLRLPRDSFLSLYTPLYTRSRSIPETFHPPPLSNFEIGRIRLARYILDIARVHSQPCAYSLLNRFAHPVDDFALTTSILSLSLPPSFSISPLLITV